MHQECLFELYKWNITNEESTIVTGILCFDGFVLSKSVLKCVSWIMNSGSRGQLLGV